MFQKTIFLLLILAGLVCEVDAQDKITLLNGKVLEGTILDTTSNMIKYEWKKKNNKVREDFIDKYRIYSITDANDIETIFYQQDSLIGNFFTEEEMKYFVLGSQDAINGYKAPLVTVGGIVLGIGTVMYDTYDKPDGGSFGDGLYNGDASVLNLAVPFVYTVGAGVPKIKIDLNKVSDPSYLSHETYILGYERTARSKKVMNALKGSIIGILSGFVVYTIAK